MAIRVEQKGNGGLAVTIMIPFTAKDVEKIRSVPGRTWEARHRHWLVPLTEETLQLLVRLFKEDEWIIGASIRKNVRDTIQHLQEQSSSQVRVEAILKQTEEILKLKGFGPKTAKAYLGHIRRFLMKHSISADQITAKEVSSYLLQLLEQRNSSSYVNQAVSAFKFLFQHTLHKPSVIPQIPRPKKEAKLPVILSQQEVFQLLRGPDNLKHKTLLYVIYSSGLRVGEVVRLKIQDIDAKRMLIHIRQSKGKKDRYTVLSEAALEILREYARFYKPAGCFQGWTIVPISQNERCSTYLRRPAGKRELKRRSRYTHCAIPLRPIYWKPAQT
jgi:integrase/recombinase XerD